ncbi:MAG: cysteine hydrolase [Ectothiorhodospiraceae bacterium]|nr:cysteine hydrolase [Ectothiorhodospiraceae bacterium]
MFSVFCDDGRVFEAVRASTALLVIDMQRDFLDSNGMCAARGADISHLAGVVPAVERLLAAARESATTVIHTREGYAPDLHDVHPPKRARGSVGTPGPLGRFLIRGEPGHDFVDRLRPWPGEPVVDKPGFGAFYRTELDALLAERGISHLVICGVTTQCCVASTLREATDRGFWCLTVSDACAAIEPAHHDATLAVIRSEGDLFGWIARTDDVVAGLRGG